MLDDYQNGRFIFKLFGDLEKQLNSAKEQILTLSDGKVQLLISSNGEDFTVEILNEQVDGALLDKILKMFINTFSNFIYANEEIDLATHAVRLLKLSGLTLKTAESFTGGAVANAIVNVPGASEVFFEGLVCYNTRSKIDRLGVDPLTVSSHTVVSREVAFEMVKGLIESGNCDIAIATTGYASPTQDGKGGLCYIAVANELKAEVSRYHFSGTREEIMQKGKDHALFALIKRLRSSTANL